MIYLQLFFSFLQVGMFSFGGGYAAMPLIQGQVVTAHKWLSMSESLDDGGRIHGFDYDFADDTWTDCC